LRGLRKESELPMSSAVKRMAAMLYWAVVEKVVSYTMYALR
jgi:hypothetical protein